MLKLDRAERDEVKPREMVDEEKHIKETKPSFSPNRYAGIYTDDLHSSIVVTAQDGRLSATFQGLTFDFEHWHHDTFRALDRANRLPKHFGRSRSMMKAKSAA